MTLPDLLAAADSGPWWFDGRDIFHKDGIMDQLIIPIPTAEETFHPSQGVLPATAKLAALAPEMAALLIEARDMIRVLHGKCLFLGPCVTCDLLDRIDGLTDRRTEA